MITHIILLGSNVSSVNLGLGYMAEINITIFSQWTENNSCLNVATAMLAAENNFQIE